MSGPPAPPVRVGGIDYLNALPLTRYLEAAGDPAFLISSHAPSLLATLLREGQLDVALVPVVEYLARPEYRIVPGLCIASYGAVLSIRLYHRQPLSAARVVALDTSSRTSSMLTRVLFRQLWQGAPRFIDLPPREAIALLEGSGRADEVDAVLLIGDAALATEAPPGWDVQDLGTVWTRWTGLPFVYAFWVWRGGEAPAGLTARLHDAWRLGTARVDDIVRSAHLPPGLEAAAARHYLARVIQYELGQPQIDGLLAFYGRLESIAGQPTPRSLAWLEERRLLPV